MGRKERRGDILPEKGATPWSPARYGILALFSITIGLSAFLLFSVEPLLGRLTLPIFGGTPAVWATVLCFFQAILLAGYLYAHLSVTWLGPRRGAVLHILLALIALVLLMVAPTRLTSFYDPGQPTVLNLLEILFLAVGPPAFLITTTTPLLSSWFAAIHHSEGVEADPYWLYALSNAGSFAALLAYPFLIEPNLGLLAQRSIWVFGMIFLVGCLAVCGLVVLRRVGPTLSRAARGTTAGVRVALGAPPITWNRRARWLLLAAVPSGLLSAVTNFITTDLISAPLLWVIPLAIYLLTFVIAFSDRGRRVLPRAEWLAPAAITLLWLPFGSTIGWPILPLLLLEFVGLGIIATTLHGRLASDRPEPARLTEFYLILSVGGVLASSFVAILAPLIFKGVWEYPLLLVLALVALAWGKQPRLVTPRRRFNFSPLLSGASRRVWPYVFGCLLLSLAMLSSGSNELEGNLGWMLVGGAILLLGAQPRFLAFLTGMVLLLGIFVLTPPVLLLDRSFFGVTVVGRPVGTGQTILLNGTTIHGTQSTNPALRDIPTSYYAPHGPLGDVFAVLRTGANGAGQVIGAVGLGAGTISAYSRVGDQLTFFEIDPLVIRVASDPAYFTYLSDSAARPRIVLGDARLSLQAVASGTYDLLVLDAFSSDSIPAHLLTVEALADDARTLRPGALLAINISNRYYDLAPVLSSAAASAGLITLERIYHPNSAESGAGAFASEWLAATNNLADLAALRKAGWQSVPTGARPLTDDYSDLLRLLRPGIW